METKLNYYQREIETKLKPDGKYPMSIEIRDGQGGKTNYMDINKESVPVIVEFLLKAVQRD